MSITAFDWKFYVNVYYWICHSFKVQQRIKKTNEKSKEMCCVSKTILLLNMFM